MAFSVDALSEPTVSPEEAVSSLRELRETLGQVSELASEEDVTVQSFLDTLGSISVTISGIALEPSLLPRRLGSVEDARMNDEGELILTTPDGGIKTVDLTSFDNRDLLVTVLGDLLEKLRELADRLHDLPEIIVDEPDIESTVVDEPIVLEPPVIEAVVEPEVIEEPLSTPEELVKPVEKPPVSIKPELGASPDEMISQVQHDLDEYEPTLVSQTDEDPNVTPTVLSTSVPRRSRDQVLRERSEASQRLSEIRLLREAKFNRLRIGANEPRIQEKTGVLASLKKLLSRRSRKR
jgi:hypothetical protein